MTDVFKTPDDEIFYNDLYDSLYCFFAELEIDFPEWNRSELWHYLGATILASLMGLESHWGDEDVVTDEWLEIIAPGVLRAMAYDNSLFDEDMDEDGDDDEGFDPDLANWEGDTMFDSMTRALQEAIDMMEEGEVITWEDGDE